MAGVVVDTDVVSFTFKKDTRSRRFRPLLLGKELVISFMTLAELEYWALRRKWGQATRARLARYLQSYEVYYADADLCGWWAEVRRRADKKGQPIDTQDAWIAATALALGVPLVTHNPDDYAAVAGLEVQTAAAL